MSKREHVMLMLPAAPDRVFVSKAEERRFIYQHHSKEADKVIMLTVALGVSLEFELLEAVGALMVRGTATQMELLLTAPEFKALGIAVADDAEFYSQDGK